MKKKWNTRKKIHETRKTNTIRRKTKTDTFPDGTNLANRIKAVGQLM